MADCVQVLKVKRPFKICNSERKNKKGIVCSDLEDLKRMSCEHLSLTNGCRAFLESDGTEIADDEYFQCLSVQTLFVVTSVEGQWLSDVGRSDLGIYVDTTRRNDNLFLRIN